MCKLENIETSTTLRLIDDTSEFIMVKGHLGTALIEITDTVLKYLVESGLAVTIKSGSCLYLCQ